MRTTDLDRNVEGDNRCAMLTALTSPKGSSARRFVLRRAYFPQRPVQDHGRQAHANPVPRRFHRSCDGNRQSGQSEYDSQSVLLLRSRGFAIEGGPEKAESRSHAWEHDICCAIPYSFQTLSTAAVRAGCLISPWLRCIGLRDRYNHRSTAMSATAVTKTTLQSTKDSFVCGRMISLDVFRGLTIAAMILVNNPGNGHAYWPLEHARWNGWTPTDLIFPFFLFIVGVSMVLSFESRLARHEAKSGLLRHSLRRAATIFAIGVALNAFPYYHVLPIRIPGVLQRIGVTYAAAALLTLHVGRRGRIATVIAILVGYWALMRFAPVPGLGVPVRDFPLLDPDRNLAAWLDRRLIPGRLYEITRDPEGLLSTLPAIGSVLLGVFTGEWLRSKRRAEQKAFGLFAWGVAGLIAGRILDFWMPINKKLWTSSYVLFTAGFALIILALCYWLVDIRALRGAWTKPFVVFGTNAIAAYTLASLLAKIIYRTHFAGQSIQRHIFMRVFAPLGSPSFTSLLYSLAYVTVCLLVIWVLYRRHIFIKI